METPIYYYPFFFGLEGASHESYSIIFATSKRKKMHISIISGSTARRSCRNLQRQIRPTATSKLKSLSLQIILAKIGSNGDWG